MEIKIHCLYDQMMPPHELEPHPKNRNKHPKDQIERLAKILLYQGFRYPIKISSLSGKITSGHGRLEAAKLLGLATVPVVMQDYDDEVQEYADVQADNAIAAWAELDLSGINVDIGELGPFDLDMLGLKNFTVVPEFEPGTSDEQGKLDEKKPVQCPNCGEQFVPKS